MTKKTIDNGVEIDYSSVAVKMKLSRVKNYKRKSKIEVNDLI